MISLRVEGDGPVTGFWYLWLKSVTGFNPRQHCEKCLLGRRCRDVKPGMVASSPIALPTGADYYYLCGVASTRRWADNMHLAVLREPGATATVTSYTGRVFVIENAVEIPIPELPEGYEGLDTSFTTCRNFRFGTAMSKALGTRAWPKPQMRLL